MVNNLAALKEVLSKQVEDTIYNNVAYEVADKLSEYIFKRVYNAYEPIEYQRQFELLNSVSIKVEPVKKMSKGYKYQVKVYCDYSKMNHTNWAGKKVYVATFVNDGSTINRPKAEFIKYTMDDFSRLKSYIAEFKKEMIGKGYIIT